MAMHRTITRQNSLLLNCIQHSYHTHTTSHVEEQIQGMQLQYRIVGDGLAVNGYTFLHCACMTCFLSARGKRWYTHVGNIQHRPSRAHCKTDNTPRWALIGQWCRSGHRLSSSVCMWMALSGDNIGLDEVIVKAKYTPLDIVKTYLTYECH
jgi:hypothetical protein